MTNDLELYVMRHAESSRGDSHGADHERQLTPRGERAADLVGGFLAQHGPALVLCSSATRARQTLERVVARLPTEPEILVEQGLYCAGASTLLQRIREVEGRPSPILLVGHNPDVEQLTLSLADDSDGSELRRVAAKFPAGAFARLTFAIGDWASLSSGTGVLRAFRTPEGLV